MQVCHDCNHPLEADDLFCGHCGSAVGATGRSVIVADPQPDPSARAGSALGSLEAALRADTSDAGRLVFAAFERLCEGEIDDALLAAESAVTLNPRMWSAHLIAGVTRNQRGETEQAEAHLHDALQLEPTAVHYKACLERLLASSLPKRRLSLGTPRFPALSPGTWAAIVGVPVLLVSLMTLAMSGSNTNEFSRNRRPTFGGVNGVNPSPTAPIQPVNRPFPTPSRTTPPAPAPTYTPPPQAYPPSSYSNNRPSAPPPIRYDDDSGSAPALSATRRGPGPLPRADDDGPIYPLPPASPDVSNTPDLRSRTGGTDNRVASQRNVVPAEPTPWAKKPSSNRASGGMTLSARPVGNASIGAVAPATRSTLPPPSDAVTNSSRVRSAPAPPPARPEPAPAAEEAPRPTGRAIHSTARRLQSQGRLDEAEKAFRNAITTYQQEMAEGKDPRGAEYGILSARAALDLMENR